MDAQLIFRFCCLFGTLYITFSPSLSLDFARIFSPAYSFSIHIKMCIAIDLVQNDFAFHWKIDFTIWHNGPFQRFIKYNWNTLLLNEWVLAWSRMCAKNGVELCISSLLSWLVSSSSWCQPCRKFTSFEIFAIYHLHFVYYYHRLQCGLCPTSLYIVCIWRLLHCSRGQNPVRLLIHMYAYMHVCIYTELTFHTIAPPFPFFITRAQRQTVQTTTGVMNK